MEHWGIFLGPLTVNINRNLGNLGSIRSECIKKFDTMGFLRVLTWNLSAMDENSLLNVYRNISDGYMVLMLRLYQSISVSMGNKYLI